MSLVAMLLRAQLRTRWRSWIGLAVLIGVLGGAIIATLAGARRTETAYDRFLAQTNALDVLVTNGGTTPDNVNEQFDFDDVAALPEVLDGARLGYYFPVGGEVDGEPITQSSVAPLVRVDERFGTELNRFRVLDGRLPEREHEIAVTPLVTETLGVRVGDELRLALAPPTGPDAAAPAPVVDFEVVGSFAMAGGFPPATGGLPPPVLLSGEYRERHPGYAELFAARLRRGVGDLETFERSLIRLAGGEQVVTGNSIEFGGMERSLAVQATALRIVAALIAAVGTMLLGQVLVRQGLLRATTDRDLAALGVTRGQLRVTGVVWGGGSAAVAMLVAVAVAIALSPLAPSGIGRDAEIEPGVDVNVAYVGGGALAMLLVVGSLSAISALLAARRATTARAVDRAGLRVGAVISAVGRSGLSPVASSGVRMALEPGRGQSAVPVRATIATATLAVGAIASVLVFSASLQHLFDDPEQFGWRWDIQLGDPFAPALDDEVAALATDPSVEALAAGAIARVDIAGVLVDVLGVDERKGSLEPTLVDGREPVDDDEIVLGARTLRDIDAAIDDTVSVRVGERSATFVVVGRAVLAESSGLARLGHGGWMTFAGLRRIVPDAPVDVALVRATDDADGRAVVDELIATHPGNTYLPKKPSDLSELDRAGGLPSGLAALIGTLAVVGLTHALLSSVRRRRRELAILKALGYVRSQIMAAVAWQATVMALIAALLGVPLGVIAGQAGWRAFASELGVPGETSIPLLALALLAVATVAVANLTAAIPARAAGRTPAAAVRTE